VTVVWSDWQFCQALCFHWHDASRWTELWDEVAALIINQSKNCNYNITGWWHLIISNMDLNIKAK